MANELVPSNPAGYPPPPVLSESEKKKNREWVAQKRAENAAKGAEKAKTATPTPTPTATGPSRPSFSPAGPPKAARVSGVEASRQQGGPVVGDPFTRAGMEKIRSGEHVDPRTPEGMRLIRAQKEAVLAEGPDVPITDPVRFDAHLVRHSPAKKAAIADYVNQQQAGLITSGLEAARSNMALAGRGVRMVKGYLQTIKSDPAGMQLHPEMQEAVAFDNYVRGSAEELTKRIDRVTRASSGATDPTSAAAAYKRGTVATIAGRGITGDPTNPLENTVGKPKASARRGPVGGVRGRSFAADVAGKGGIKATLRPGTETVTTRIDPDPTPGKPRSARAEAGEGPATGKGQGPAKPVVLDLRGSGASAGSDRGRERAPTPELQADIDRAADFIKSHVEEHGDTPSVGGIAKALGITKSRAQRLWENAQIASTEAVSTKRTKTEERRSAVKDIMELPPTSGGEDIEAEPLDSVPGGYFEEGPESDREVWTQRTRASAKPDIPATPATRNPRSAKRRSQRISDAEKLERQRAAKAAADAERENKNKKK